MATQQEIYDRLKVVNINKKYDRGGIASGQTPYKHTIGVVTDDYPKSHRALGNKAQIIIQAKIEYQDGGRKITETLESGSSMIEMSRLELFHSIAEPEAVYNLLAKSGLSTGDTRKVEITITDLKYRYFIEK